jgi:uncharacterized protein
MMKKSSILLLIILFANFASFGQSLPERPDPPRLVNDFANIIPDGQEQQLESKLVNYNDTTSTQIVIVTMPNLEGYPISEFSYELGDKWGVGQEGKDNGLVITVAVEERKTFIATGWGVEGYVTDVMAKRIVDNVMVPEFRQGDFHAGLNKAADVIMGLMSGTYDAENLKSTSDDDIPSYPFIVVIVIIILVIWMASKSKGGGGQINKRGWSGPIIFPSGGSSWGSGGGSSGGGGFGGFGGGSFGGGGAGGSW